VRDITVIVDERSDELLCLQHWKQFERLGLGQHVAGLEQLASRHEVIALDTSIVVRQLPPPITC